MKRYVVTSTDDGSEVYIDLLNSSAGKYLSRRPYLLAIIKEAVEKNSLNKNRTVIEQDMGRKIGTTDIISTEDKDSIYYALPIKSKTYSRFAKNRYPQQSDTLTLIVDRDNDGNFEISNTWIGAYCPAFPGDDNETKDSRNYWEGHALVHDSITIQSKTITKDCPY